MNYESFEKNVKSMTAAEIIMAMVNGLRNKKIKIDMSSFGRKESNGVCFGCAATCTIIEINGFDDSLFADISVSESVKARKESNFLSEFENAIDYLRSGKLLTYNKYARSIGFATINFTKDLSLPELNQLYSDEMLEAYEYLAKSQSEPIDICTN